MLDKTYKTILIDPPWNQKGGGKVKRGADRHYKLMKEPQMTAVIQDVLDGKLDEDAHMYLWVANNHLPDSSRACTSARASTRSATRGRPPRSRP